jgi:hypothetical protein
MLGLALHGVLYVGYTRVLRAHKAVRSDRWFVTTAPRSVQLLVAGDSHPRTAIDPNELGDRVVNLAIGGEHYLKTWYRMRLLVEGSRRQVSALLLPFDAASFSSWHGDNFAPEWVWGRYVDFLEVGRVRGDLWRYAGRELKAELFPYAGELRTLNQLRTRRFGFGEELPGGDFSALSLADRRASALVMAADHLKDQELVDPGLRWAFEQLLTWARERDTRVVLVSFPVTRHYWQWIERSGADRRVAEEVLPQVQADPRVIWLDYHDLYFDRDELFADPHHLNPRGRVRFTARLREDLVARGVLAP